MLNIVYITVLVLALVGLGGTQVAHATRQSWRYDAGYLQGISGVELNKTTTHTQEFMSGYTNGSKQVLV